MNSYIKGLIAVLTAVASAVVAFGTDGNISTVEWINVAIAAVTAAGVFAAPNVPGAKYTKAILAGLGAVLVTLTSAITGGISQSELIQLAVAFLGAAGVYQFPNKDGQTNISETGNVGNV